MADVRQAELDFAALQDVPHVAADESGGRVAVPGDPGALLRADFYRQGDDLIVATPDGPVAVVEGYFAATGPVDLELGVAVLPARTVGILAKNVAVGQAAAQGSPARGDADPSVHEIAAEEADAAALARAGHSGGDGEAVDTASAPIAVVEDMTGQVWVVRLDGTRVPLEIGMPVYQEDTVVTGNGGTLGLRFVDGMSFSLGQDARMVLEEFRYDPQTGDGGGLLSVVHGAFSFVSGRAAKAHEDALQIEMPTMTIGVRGTKVAGFAAAEGEISRVALLAEDDGTVGKIMVKTDGGSYLITDANTMVEAVSRFMAPLEPVRISTDTMHEYFSSALTILPSAAPKPGHETKLQQIDVDSLDDGPADLRAVKKMTFEQDLAADKVPVQAQIKPASVEAAPQQPKQAAEAPAATTTTAATATKTAATTDDNQTGESTSGGGTTTPPAPPPAPTNSAPVLDTSGAPALPSIVEDAATPAGSLVSAIVIDGSITDADGAAVEAIAITGVGAANGTWQYSLDDGASYQAVGAVSANSALLLSGDALLRFVPGGDYNGTATFTYKAWDMSSGSNGATGADTTSGTAFSVASETASIVVTAVNDAPVLDTSGAPALTTILEDVASPAGDSVASIVVGGSITDPDGAAVTAIAVTGADNSNGTWEYSTDGGATFSAVGAVGANSALLLDSAAKLRFVPSGDYNGTATFTYKAWDMTSGSNGATGVDTTSGTAFSVASETASIVVTAVNDAPVLDTSGAPSLTAVLEDALSPAGDTVASIVVGGSITDPDGAAVTAIAVTGADNSNGSWEYSTDGGATFSAVGAVGANSALLLDASAKLRFVPSGDYNGTATFTYKAWDMSSGGNGATGVDTTAGTAFSAASETASIVVTAVNDAPVLDTVGAPTLTTIVEDVLAPAGDTVAQIVIGGSITDPDGNAVEAIALVGADGANGTWEYSTDGGATFSAVGAVGANAALLLDSAAKLRFVPDAGYNGQATISYKAWDMSAGANGDAGVDTSAGTAFSSATESASITVTAVNDRPVLDTSGTPVLTAIAEDSAAPAGDTVASLVTGAITDPDGVAVEAIAITGVDNSNGTWEYSIDAGVSFWGIGAVTETSALLLGPAALVRFVPSADYNGSATLSYKAWDMAVGASGDSGVNTQAGTAFSLATETASITVTPVNDAPVLDTAGTPSLTGIVQDTAAPAGDTVASIVADGSITDPDGAAVEAIAIVGLDNTNGTWEFSTDGGASFGAIGAVSAASAMLLDSSAMIRFVPNAGYSGTATFSYKAWDMSAGASGNTGVDTTVGTAFSAATETASITIDPGNNAPVLDTTGAPALTAIAEDTAAPAGDTVAAIVIDGSITDADGAAVEAIAVTAADNSNGIWEYSLDGGANFFGIGAVSPTSALLLDATAMIRFVPLGDYNGTATFGYKAWDMSAGASGDSGVDTTAGSAYSSQAETATITVTAVNDAPVLDTSGAPSLGAIAENSADPAGSTVGAIVIDGSITDVDGAVEAIAVTGVDDANGTWEFSTDGGATFTAIGAVTETSALLLDASAVVRFVPDADFDGTATFSYKAWDGSMGANGDTGVDTTVGTAFSAAIEAASVAVVEASNNPDFASGSEFRVNTYTDGDQSKPVAAALDDGGYVVVWESSGQDGSLGGIYGQRYDAQGAVQGSEFRVNVTTTDSQDKPAVAALDGGGFVVAWNSNLQDGSLAGVFAQRYDDGGNPVGGEFQVNSTTFGSQKLPSVTGLQGGGFVVTWHGDDADKTGVFGQRYDSSGSPVGSEFQVNTTSLDKQENAKTVALNDGGFLVVWESNDQDADKLGVFARRFDASGNAVTAEFRVNTSQTKDQYEPDAAALADGGFVVVWQSKHDELGGKGIFGQRYDSSGNPVEFEFAIDTNTAYSQKEPSVTALNDGGFLVSWQSSGQDGDLGGIYAQRFNADGDPIGGELRLNTTTVDSQGDPALVTLTNGGVVAVWQSANQDGSGSGIYGHQFQTQAASANSAPIAAGAQMLDLDGFNEYVDVGDPGSGALDLELKDMTVEAWFYYDGASAGTEMIVSKGNDWYGDKGYSIFLDNGELVGRVNSGGTTQPWDTAATKIAMPAEAGWYHVAMVIDQEAGAGAGSVTGYLNGSNAGWTSGHGSVSNDVFTSVSGGTDNGDNFVIGAVDTGLLGRSDHFDGQIADVRVWNKARSEAEIAADMGRTLNGNEDNLVANWRLDDGAGTTAVNAVAGGASGTLYGGAGWQSTSSYTVAQNGTLDGRATATDSDGDTLTFGVGSGPTNGTAMIDAQTGAWEYTPNAGYTGNDNFSYQISDGTDTDTVSISVSVA